MDPNHRQPSRAGGFIIAASILIGAVVGVAVGQPSIGVIGGTGLGSGLALLLWLRDRRR